AAAGPLESPGETSRRDTRDGRWWAATSAQPLSVKGSRSPCQEARPRPRFGYHHVPSGKARGRSSRRNAQAALSRGDKKELRRVYCAGRTAVGGEHHLLSGSTERSAGCRQENL